MRFRRKQLMVAGTGLVDRDDYRAPPEAVVVRIAFGPYRVGTVIPAMARGERLERIRLNQVAPYRARKRKTLPVIGAAAVIPEA